MDKNITTIEVRLDNIECLIKEQALNHKLVLNMDEVSQYTGLSKLYLYKLTSKNKIPFYKPNGKIIRFKKDEIDQWLLRNRNSTDEEIHAEAITQVTLGKTF